VGLLPISKSRAINEFEERSDQIHRPINQEIMKFHHAFALSFFSLALATPGVMAQQDQTPAGTPREANANPVLEDYAAVSTALYKDDLAAAKKAAAGMVKNDKDSAMTKHAQAIADSKDIDQARIHFKELSDIAVPAAKKEKTMHQMHCPMAMDGKGADWLQKSADEIQNPYMGAKMPHCGKMVK